LLYAVRGATTLTANTTDAMLDAVGNLLTPLMANNGLQPHHLLTVFFTTTPDITACSAAKAARLTQEGWQHVPLLCAVEPTIEGLPTLCVRVLLQVQGIDETHLPLKPLYLNGATVLRPDLAG
jgi:chorismate mutase